MRRPSPRLLAGLMALSAAFPASAETIEESCRFAEALSGKLHMPDMALRYLEPLRPSVPADRRPLYDATLLGLLESLIQRPDTDSARRDALLKRSREAAKPTMDKLAPSAKTPAYALEDFRIALASLRIERAAAVTGTEPGAALKRLHLELGRIYDFLQNTLLPQQLTDAKVDLMVEYEMFHGNTVLLARSGVMAAGLGDADRLALLKAGVEKFESAYATYEEENKPDVVAFPHALLGQAQCLRHVAELSATSDPAGSKKSLDESRRILSQIVGNPINPNIPAPEALLQRYRAVQEILQIAAKAKDLAPARTALAAFRAKASGRGEGKDRGDLLQAQIDWEESRLGKPDLANRAKGVLSELKSAGGPVAPEAETLLSDWEGGAGRAGGVDWRKSADEAFNAKNFDQAVRRYRAAIRCALRGQDEQVQYFWLSMARSYFELRRPLEAIVAAERAAACLMTGKYAERAAELATVLAYNLPKPPNPPYPPAALKAVRKRCYLLMTRFENNPMAQTAAYLLGLLHMDERDYAFAEGQFASVKPGSDSYPSALYSLGKCRVRRLKALEREGKSDSALAEAAETALARFQEGNFPAKDLDSAKADAAFLRAELNSQTRPEAALKILDAFPVSYPEAKDLIADLPRLKSIALASKGDWAGAAKAWDEATANLGARPWPLAVAQTLLKICADKGAAAGLKMTLTNQIASQQPFVFSKAAERFKENCKHERWADAIAVGETILENIAGNPAYEENEDNAKWLKWLRTVRLPECYVKTESWAKAVALLAEAQDLRIIQGRYEVSGQIPPPLKGEDVGLWRMTALASVRHAEQMPPGEERKAVAARAASSWKKILERLGTEDKDYWTVLLDTLKSEILSGQYQAARERLHGKFISFPELGGQRDRFLEMLKGLAQTEPGFAEVSAAMTAELE